MLSEDGMIDKNHNLHTKTSRYQQPLFPCSITLYLSFPRITYITDYVTSSIAELRSPLKNNNPCYHTIQNNK